MNNSPSAGRTPESVFQILLKGLNITDQGKKGNILFKGFK
jgi:hypothetical protein